MCLIFVLKTALLSCTSSSAAMNPAIKTSPPAPGLLIRPDNTVEVRIDGEKTFSGSLLQDMQPPVNPPQVQWVGCRVVVGPWSGSLFLALETRSD